MATVKFVHVLKRIEYLDQCIQELKELMATLRRDRPYYESVKIALEQAINNLLNERVKLMELKIENPLPHLSEEVVTHQMELKRSPMYDLENLKANWQQHQFDEAKTFIVKEFPEVAFGRENVRRRSSLRSDLLRDFPDTQY
ncbi:MAG: hypothetical protein NZM25_07655 [Leptospiraceae bacterium]|nr:hypothetical protein [Leptospiraceae bacterium]MDW8305474.1 hypothetical protein [Leptospiraceae bacterium]